MALCVECAQIFDDAYKSQLSCVILDGIERLLGLSWILIVYTVDIGVNFCQVQGS